MSEISKPLIVYIPDTRSVVISRFGKGNLKIGLGVYTYSRLPGLPHLPALGTWPDGAESTPDGPWLRSDLLKASKLAGTCPGSSKECRSICYAVRPVQENGAVMQMWRANAGSDVPPIPDDAKILRLHISGDFDTPQYVVAWYERLIARPDVTAWVYTRSWRVPELLPGLELIRALPNVQMFASMDESIPEMPPSGWRRAWIDGDVRGGTPQEVAAHAEDPVIHNLITVDGTPSFVCPEETNRVANCEECGYCFRGTKNDVTFLRH